ncbi:MAG TPA: IclR family transcriptional regulator [Xanthobacteraceae bacterium]
MSTAPVNTRRSCSAPGAEAPAGVGLLLKTFHILDLFSDREPAWSQAEIARATGLARSTVSRLVRFLCLRNYLLEQHGRYRLGFAAVDLGRRAQLQFNLVELCADALQELAERSGETVILAGYDHARASVVCLAQLPSLAGGLRVFENVGAAYPLHSGATGKAVLAFLPDARLQAVLAGDITPLNPASRTSRAALKAQIAQIREQGYAVTREETYPGVAGVAVPIRAGSGQPLGSIAIAGPLHRMRGREIAAHAHLLLKIAERLARRLTG